MNDLCRQIQIEHDAQTLSNLAQQLNDLLAENEQEIGRDKSLYLATSTSGTA
jgi:hypothetical protein